MKKELIYDLDYKNMTKAELRAATFNWVELEPVPTSKNAALLTIGSG